MRYLVLSDLHGATEELAKALTYFDKYQCDYLILLGDLLNHGPRNPVPGSYEPPKVIDMLNQMHDKVISVRGNCDGEVDGMMFNFPCNAPYHIILVPDPKGAHESGRTKVQKLFLTHGHLYKIDHEDPQKAIELRNKIGLKENDIVLSGHTHIAGVFVKSNGIVNVNPGSPILPKGGTKAGFALVLEDRIECRDLDDNLVASHNFVFS